MIELFLIHISNKFYKKINFINNFLNNKINNLSLK